MSAIDETRSVDVRASFRHSAGRLGSVFLSALREGHLLGWKTGTPARVMVPPRDLGGGGEWVDIGPGASLDAYAPADWSAGADDDSSLALVTVDGADVALLARLRPAASAGTLAPGARLVLRFAEPRRGAMSDFWFEPELF